MAKKVSLQLAEEILNAGLDITDKKIAKAQYDKSYNVTILGINQDFTDDVTEEEQEELINKYSIPEVPDKDNYYTFKINGNYYVKSSNTHFNLYENVKIRIPNGNWDNMYIEVQRDTTTDESAEWFVSVGEPTEGMKNGDYWIELHSNDSITKTIKSLYKWNESDSKWNKEYSCVGAFVNEENNAERFNHYYPVNPKYYYYLNSGSYSHAEGYEGFACGDYSHVEGYKCETHGKYGHAEGCKCKANGEGSHAEGNSIANGKYSHSEGVSNAIGDYSHAEGNGKAYGKYSCARGKGEAYGDYSYADSYGKAYGNYSHAFGGTVYGEYSCGESGGNVGTEDCPSNHSHADSGSRVIGDVSHADSGSTVNGDYSHADSDGSALGDYCHASCRGDVRDGYCTFVSGEGMWSTSDYATAFGRYCGIAASDAFTIGGGTTPYIRGESEDRYKNASGSALTVDDIETDRLFLVTWEGNAILNGTLTTIGADYAEYYEWLDGNSNNEDRVGLFVTLDGENIKTANANDNYILGVISATPCIIGDAQEINWNGRYKKDIFGRHILRENGTKITSNKYDQSQQENYIPYKDRPEKSPVGTHGKLIVIDDGTCEVNGYCGVADGGIGTKCDDMEKVYRGLAFRVLKRLDETHIRIVIK